MKKSVITSKSGIKKSVDVNVKKRKDVLIILFLMLLTADVK